MNSFANTIIINNQQSTNGNSRHRITSCGKDDDSSCDYKPNKLVFPWKYLSADQLANSSGNCNNSDKFHHESVEEKDNIHWLTADRVLFYKNT